MPCANCGNPNTIRAHLIPQLFCKQVQEGKSHAAQVTGKGKFLKTQSGIFDTEILCETCDGKLGDLENYAGKLFKGLVALGSGKIGQVLLAEHADAARILRFSCGILYKYSLTRVDYGRIALGRYQEVCRQVAFGKIEPPEELDVLLLRPLRFNNDRDIFAYRAPIPHDPSGINAFRMMVGGMVVIVKLDERPLPKNITDTTLRATGKVFFRTEDARNFEEYQKALNLSFNNERLYNYLKKVESQK